MTLKIIPSGTVNAGVSHWFKQKTLAQVAQAIVARGEAGSATFEFDPPKYWANGDKLTRVDLKMKLSIKMPKWSRYARRPKAERREWNRFYKALRYHEDGHIKIFRDEAPTTYEVVKKATPDTLQSIFDSEVARIQKLSDEYDERTHHGLKQATPHGTTVIQIP